MLATVKTPCLVGDGNKVAVVFRIGIFCDT